MKGARLLFIVFILFFASSNIVFAVSEANVLIVSDDAALPTYDEITSVNYYSSIIGNISIGSGVDYNVTIWLKSSDGSLPSNYLQSFGIVIWTTGAYYSSAPSSSDITAIENYVGSGGNLIISGAYILYDWAVNSFTNNVLHADNVGVSYTYLRDINITNTTHIVTQGFSQSELLTATSSPNGHIYDPDTIGNLIGGGAQSLAVRGPASNNPGYSTIVAFENSTNNARVLYFAFPLLLLNTTNQTLLVKNAMKFMDEYAPTINNVSLSPSSSDTIDPNVQINITLNVTDLNNVSTVILGYKCAAGTGICSPGTDVFTNITMVFNTSTHLYENASFTPDVPGVWQYMVWGNDTLDNNNYTIYNLSVQYDYSWNRTPILFNSTSCFFSTSCHIGNITINNTGDYSLDFDISSSFGNMFFNSSSSFTLAAGAVKYISVNATAQDSKAETSILITIDSTTANADPSVLYVNSTLISYAGGPYFDVKIVTYNVSVNQSTTINLSAYVQNIGNQTATGTWLNWTLPSGWANISGNLSLYIGNLSPNSISYNNIIVNVSSLVSVGASTILAKAICTEGINDSDSKDVNTYCNNGDGICGAGCTYDTTSTVYDSDCSAPVTTSTGGGGGAGGGGAPSSESFFIESSKTIEVVRGGTDSFEIQIFNKYNNKSLQNLKLELTGYLSQYMVVTPGTINLIGPGELKSFKIELRAPSYKSYEEHYLNATVSGSIITEEGVIKDYREVQHVKLLIEEVGSKNVDLNLQEAKSLIALMNKKGYGTTKVERLLNDAETKLKNNRNKEAQDLLDEIFAMNADADKAYDLINNLKSLLEDPSKDYSLFTGNAVQELDFTSEQNLSFTNTTDRYADGSFFDLSIGKSKFTSQSIEETLNLAIIAFQREDFKLSEERANNALFLLVLERKGNIALFFYLYWHYILVVLVLSIALFWVGFNVYKKVRITQKILDINREEDNIRKLISNNQRDYFSGKISHFNFEKIAEQHVNKLSKLNNERIKLRNKRVKLLRPEEIRKELELERKDIEKNIMKIQEEYYKSGKISVDEYRIQFNILNERLAEIEDESTLLYLNSHKKSRKFNAKKYIEKLNFLNFNNLKFRKNNFKLRRHVVRG